MIDVVRRDLLWTPRAKQRARTVLKGERTITYTPRGTREAEAALGAQWVGPPADGPISVGLVLTDDRVHVTVVKTVECASRKLRRGDIDNYSKLILDGLNGVAWCDDRQIVGLSVKKV